MFTIFTVNDDTTHLYITTSEKYSKVLQELNIEPFRVKFWTIPYEMLALIWDNQLDYVMRKH